MAAKSNRPMPVLHKDLNGTRVRRRYLDLMIRPEALDLVKKRALITRTVRRVLEDHGYIGFGNPGAAAGARRRDGPSFRTHQMPSTSP